MTELIILMNYHFNITMNCTTIGKITTQQVE